MKHAPGIGGYSLIVALLLVAAPMLAAPRGAFAAGYGRNNNVATPDPAAPPPPVVIRFQSGQRSRYLGKEVLLISGLPALGGRPMQLAVPNVEWKDKYDPKPELEETAKSLKAGDYVLVETEMHANQPWVTKLIPYSAKPGEELPGNFVFVELFEKKDGSPSTVSLTKFAQMVDATIPAKRDKKEMVPDPAIIEPARKLSRGDVVEVSVRGGNPPVIQSIDLYKPAEQAKFMKLTDADADGQRAVELQQEGKTVTVNLPGKLQGKKFVPDARMLGSIKSLKTGAAVTFRTREADGKTWLRDIQNAPKQPESRPARR